MKYARLRSNILSIIDCKSFMISPIPLSPRLYPTLNLVGYSLGLWGILWELPEYTLAWGIVCEPPDRT